ncbi:FAD-dependent oxidoreductase [Streptomyces longwoodensis]|uniref:FAD-dependent oxidoreductase n=1 Tax=Streptomyces longwoodensis TaxID=68231 RepID=UPI00225A07CF|nr:FAD-dependent oxidoreductase [Streptomyces longwoodensis]MCX4999730.1 FAD-dependent oxidoreductase [Streptomyces longwoodensis]WTI48462.1 FAD-dependent oxidoreductase [Streptomyces longwoodensis]WUC74744.1 FAD-dependent oxidoreductase [Streptomyces longwoodensis]
MRVAVVGSGPSGVYTAQSLLQQDPEVRVDVLDRLPCPYGLVRYGVAPDHEKIKSLQQTLRTVLEEERVRFLGGVEVGAGGVPVARLRELYHAVVYCVGAATDRRLGIPGEDLPGSWSATEFVSWYSAHPDAVTDGFLRDVRSAVVVGVGNVAVDVTRILARGTAELSATDMPQAALTALGASRVDTVHMVGRRGPSQARFTTKELRELGSLPETEPVAEAAELALDPDAAELSGLPAAQRRNVEVLRGWAARPPGAARRRIRLRFFLRPVELLARDGRVGAVRFERTAPDGHGGVTGTGRFEEIEAQLVLRSVGYRGVPLEGLPFDPARGTVPHRAGRVLRGVAVAPGEYVAGWIKRGPTGVIGTNRPCAKETAASLLADAPALVRREVPADPLPLLRAAGAEPVEWSGWLDIERAEAALGAALGRGGPVKLPDRAALRAAIGGTGADRRHD